MREVRDVFLQVSQEAKDFIKRCLARQDQRPDVLALYTIPPPIARNTFPTTASPPCCPRSHLCWGRYTDPYVRNKTREAAAAADAK